MHRTGRNPEAHRLPLSSIGLLQFVDHMEPSLPSQDRNPPVRPSPRRELQLYGARPSALKVRKDSHKIKKQPPATEARQPVIIYSVSPKVIHADTSEFMSLVQRLTGASSYDTSTGGGGVPQAPPLAARAHALSDQLDGLDELGVVTASARKGVLNPAPSSSLPSVIPPARFSVPAVVGHRQLDFFDELSPSCSGSRSSSSLPIPNNLPCTSSISTTPGSCWNSIKLHDH